MNDLSTTAYFQLLTTFLKAIDQGDAVDQINKEDGIVEWSSGNLIVRLVPHHIGEQEVQEPNAIIIEADLMFLDLENKKINHDRFLILHQLNAVSRLSTGIVAFITEEGMLAINKIISLENLDQEELANQIAKVIKAAEELYEGWNELANNADARNFFEKENQDASVPPNQKA